MNVVRPRLGFGIAVIVLGTAIVAGLTYFLACIHAPADAYLLIAILEVLVAAVGGVIAAEKKIVEEPTLERTSIYRGVIPSVARAPRKKGIPRPALPVMFTRKGDAAWKTCLKAVFFADAYGIVLVPIAAVVLLLAFSGAWLFVDVIPWAVRSAAGAFRGGAGDHG